MSKRAGNVLMKPGQVRELDCAVIKALPEDITPDLAQGWIGNARALKKVLRQALLPSAEQPQVVLPALQHDADTLAQLESWERHYRDEFGMMVDFKGIFIPLRRDWTKRLIAVPQGMMCNIAFAKNYEMFPAWRWTDDLDAAVKGRNDREPGRHYAIWIRGGVEPDEVDMTANQTGAIGLSGTTLLEDLLMEGKYFRETKDHLNKQKIARCDCSRDSSGGVPGVLWYDGKFRVSRCNVGNSIEDLRPRSVVS